MDCIFCKIAANKIPATKVYEDKEFLAFLDIGPVNKGHTLVMPKKHYPTFLDLPEKELKNINVICKKVTSAVVKATNAHGYNLMINNHPAAGQEVHHVHLHIIPRYENDNKPLRQIKGKYNAGEDEALASKIKSLL